MHIRTASLADAAALAAVEAACFPPAEAATAAEITDRLAYYNAFDAYHVKHDLSAMEKLFAGYINERLDLYLSMLQEK